MTEKQTPTPLEALIAVMAPGAWEHQPDCDSVAFGIDLCDCGYMDRVRLAQAAIKKATEGIPAEASVVADLLAACELALDGLHYTREYVGEATLPAIEGWSWFDATVALKAAIAKAQGDAAVDAPGRP